MQIIKHRHFTKRSSSLRAVYQSSFDNLMGRNPIDSLARKCYRAIKGYVPTGRPARNLLFPGDQSGNGSEKGGFTGAIRAYQTDQLTGIYPHTQVINEHGLIITNRQIQYVQQQP
jgi:hypothetical protein